MTRPRVLRLITRLNVGGPARQAIYLSRAMEERGFWTELVYGSVGPGEGELGPVPGRGTRLPGLRREIAPLLDARAERTIRRLIRDRQPHVVHTHMAKAGALGRLAARRTGVPVVIHTYHGHVLEGYFSRPITSAFVAAERRLARSSDVLIAVSPSVRDDLLALGVGTPAQWRVVPVGLELDALLDTPPPGAVARARLGVPDGIPVVGVVGRLVPIKDHRTFLEAAVRMGTDRPDVVFAVAGDGELRTDLESRARALLGDRVRFLGWVEDLPALYATLDVVMLTSRNEGTPVSLIEAGAAGRPVVATRVGGVKDVVREGVTGLLAAPGDAAALAAAALRLLDEPAVAATMGTAARTWVRDRFSATRLADDLAGLYRECLDRRGYFTAVKA